MSGRSYQNTPDGRYFVVAGRLWRSTNLTIPDIERQRLVGQLMAARRAVKNANAGQGGMKLARAAVNAAKVALSERGPAWWQDGARDFNRHLAENTPYRDWAASRKPWRYHALSGPQSWSARALDRCGWRSAVRRGPTVSLLRDRLAGGPAAPRSVPCRSRRRPRARPVQSPRGRLRDVGRARSGSRATGLRLALIARK